MFTSTKYNGLFYSGAAEEDEVEEASTLVAPRETCPVLIYMQICSDLLVSAHANLLMGHVPDLLQIFIRRRQLCFLIRIFIASGSCRKLATSVVRRWYWPLGGSSDWLRMLRYLENIYLPERANYNDGTEPEISNMELVSSFAD